VRFRARARARVYLRIRRLLNNIKPAIASAREPDTRFLSRAMSQSTRVLVRARFPIAQFNVAALPPPPTLSAGPFMEPLPMKEPHLRLDKGVRGPKLSLGDT